MCLLSLPKFRCTYTRKSPRAANKVRLTALPPRLHRDRYLYTTSLFMQICLPLSCENPSASPPILHFCVSISFYPATSRKRAISSRLFLQLLSPCSSSLSSSSSPCFFSMHVPAARSHVGSDASLWTDYKPKPEITLFLFIKGMTEEEVGMRPYLLT